MKIIIDGMVCLPSLIGVPKLNFPNFKEMLYKKKDYSCIRFYTPFRKVKLLKNQPLRLWFADDTEEVQFYENYIFIEDRSQPAEPLTSPIHRPHFVLVDLLKVITLFNDTSNFSSLIKDYSIMSPRDINVSRKHRDNIVNPESHSNGTSTGTKRTCVIS